MGVGRLYELNICVIPSSSSYVEALTSNVMKFGGGVFERSLGLDEVMRMGLSGRNSVLIRREEIRALFLSCEGTPRRLSAGQEGVLTEKWYTGTLDFPTAEL